MKRKGYRYRHTKNEFGPLQDKDAKAKAAKLLEELKKVLGDDFELIVVDETTLTLDPPLRACWMKAAQQKRIPATRPGFKQKQHVLGGHIWLQDRISWIKVETKNSVHFIQFLDHLLIQQYLTGRVVLVMDNVSFHKSAPALAALSLYELRVVVRWLPAYCSDLNPIERLGDSSKIWLVPTNCEAE